MRLRLSVLLCLFVLLFSALSANAATRLRTIMNELNMNTLKVVDAVMREDFSLIESGARAIADHERAPVEERKRIVGHLGERAVVFKAVDVELHDSASAMADAAAKHDMDGVLNNLSRVQKGCVRCHLAFRSEVLELLYKQKQ